MSIAKSLFLSLVIILTSTSVASAHGGNRGYGGHWGGHHGHWGGNHGFYRRPNFGFYFGPSIGSPFYYPYYPYQQPYYSPVIISPPSSPPVYIEREPTNETREPEIAYWYFCQNPEGYYPSIKNCPLGWIKVPPRPN